MVKSWLKRAWNGGPVFWLLVAVAVLSSAGGSPLAAIEASPAPPQGAAQAAKSVAQKAAASSGGTQSSATQQAPQMATQATTPPKWGPVEPGRRDPFDVPKPEKAGGAVPGEGMDQAVGELPKGKKGLVIGQLTLEGIVDQKAANAMIAVVKSPASRAAFFLREKDEVYNGVVSKITSDSIYFTENARDLTGQMVSRQVIKKLGSGPGEK
jgi:hypothetical protein